MKPAARIAAAIEVLDRWLAGSPVEKSLKSWARGNRYAGSGDRAAIRDQVYAAIRCRRTYAWLGGAPTGRGLMLGQARARGWDVPACFSGDKYAPAALEPSETKVPDLTAADPATRLDCPDWLWLRLAWLDADREPVLSAMRDRAPVHLRANLLKCTRDEAIAALRRDGIDAAPHALAATAIELATHPRGLDRFAAVSGGLVELQDAASQAAVEFCRPEPGESALDYCAGGGGKALAIAALTGTRVTAHDANPARMRDLPTRAARAGADIEIVREFDRLAGRRYDMVFCDVPCSGSGAWQRDPEAKWRLTPGRLGELTASQAEILARAAPLVAERGRLAYATCSILAEENQDQTRAFLGSNPDWQLQASRQYLPSEGAGGFYIALFRRRESV